MVLRHKTLPSDGETGLLKNITLKTNAFYPPPPPPTLLQNLNSKVDYLDSSSHSTWTSLSACLTRTGAPC